MITSALINQCRREYGDVAKTIRMSRNGTGTADTFNLVNFPIIEGSYVIYLSGSARTETTHYTLDKDNGDLKFVTTPSNGQEVKAQYKYAHWRDLNWNEAVNQAIETLNARGFFRQVVRDKTAMAISANIQSYNGPTNCVDLYEVLQSDNYNLSGNFVKLACNWRYDQDANKFVLGLIPSTANKLAVSYLRNLKTYSATSATLDALDDWRELIKKKAGATFYRSLAGKIAKQGGATIDEGHISFSNLRTMAADLDLEFENLARRKKPARPARDIQYHLESGGVV